MRNMTKACAFLVVVCVAAFGQQQSPVQETLTNLKIIRMVQSSMSPDLIIQTISTCTPRFALDPISVENMRQNGVTEDIVKAITAKQNGQPIPGIEMAARENGTNQPVATEPPADQPQQTTQQLITAQPTAPAPIATLPTSVPNPKQQYDSKLGTITIQTDGGVFIDKNFVQAAHPAALMMTNIAFNRYVSAFGEVGYIHAKASGNIDGVNVSENTYVLDYGWGGRFIIPTGTRVVPYAVVGLDRADSHASYSATGVGALVGGAQWAWDLNFGGGVNVFVTRNIGVNFDCRIYRLLSNTFQSGYGTNWFEQAALGVVFQFNGATGKKL